MPRKPDHDLSAFRDWLEEDRLVQPATSRSYSAVVSAVLTALGDQVDQAALDLVFEPRRGRSSYANYCTGWKAFVEYAFEQGIRLPMPTKKKVLSDAGPLPEEGVALAAFLRKSKLSPASIRALTWGHVLASPTQPGDFAVADPYRPSLRVDVSALLMDPWYGLRGGEDCKDLPLFSESRGSKVRYPTKRLIRQVKALQQERRRAETAPPRLTGAAVTAEELGTLVRREAEQPPAGPALSPEAFENWHTGRHTETEPEPQEPSKSTQELIDLIEGGQDAGHAGGASGHTEDKTPASARDREPGALPGAAESPAPDSAACSVCGYPEEVHAEAHGLTDGTISNCAAENGYPEDTCQMCDNGCYGRHSFKRKEMP